MEREREREYSVVGRRGELTRSLIVNARNESIVRRFCTGALTVAVAVVVQLSLSLKASGTGGGGDCSVLCSAIFVS